MMAKMGMYMALTAAAVVTGAKAMVAVNHYLAEERAAIVQFVPGARPSSVYGARFPAANVSTQQAEQDPLAELRN